MSYCRFSSDDWQSDVYVWADISGGYRVEVAARRQTWDVPLPPKVDISDIDAWLDRWVAVSALLRDESNWHWEDCPTDPGGNSYHHTTAGECADDLVRLRGLGFNVPQSAIDGLREEADDE